jgi:hypothetical protein
VQTQITVRGEARRTVSTDPSSVEQLWSEVRAEAVNTAIDKARDFAAALGGTITSIEHIAEHEPAGVVLTHEVHAVVEVRCLATVGPVSEQSRRWIDPGQVRPAGNGPGVGTGLSPGVGTGGTTPPATINAVAPDDVPRRPRPARY